MTIRENPRVYADQKRALEQIKRATEVVEPMLQTEREKTAEDLWLGASLARTVSLQLQRMEEQVA